MNESQNKTISRREFSKLAGQIAAASALAGVAIPHVHAYQTDTVQVALVGCGGRGSGAAIDAMKAKGGPTRLVAMVDVFQDKLNNSYKSLKSQRPEQVDVGDDHKFIGFDGYKHAMDLLKPGDVVILTTPVAFRWVHFTYAIQKGLNVFMEKPITVDGPTTRRMIKLGEEASAKNLKVGVGLMCRHCKARHELFDRIKNGEIGDIIAMRCYREHGPVASAFSTKKPDNMSELLYQINRFHSFLWASGGLFSDFYIHNIDESCWMKDGWPVQAEATGGRHYRGDFVDQNFDNYSVEYTFDDNSKLFHYGRTIEGCQNKFASYAHGSKGIAVISSDSHTPAHCKIYKGQALDKNKIQWAYPDDEPNPYQLEWDDLLDAIRNNKPYNEVKRGAEASLTASMGRMSAHTGQKITFDQIMNSPHEFAPDVDKLTMDSPAPIQAGPDGRYPLPQPGIIKDREY